MPLSSLIGFLASSRPIVPLFVFSVLGDALSGIIILEMIPWFVIFKVCVPEPAGLIFSIVPPSL